MKILDSNKLKIGDITDSIKAWLYYTYNQTLQVFSASSPFGHILTVINEYFQLLILYLEDIAVEANISTAVKRRSILGHARIAGHNPTRGISANGTVKLYTKSNYVNDRQISTVIIPDKTSLLCTNNTRKYFLSIGNYTNSLKVNVSSREIVSAKIIQGDIETKNLVSTGLNLQSYSIISKGSIDNNLVWVTVNGEKFSNVDSLWDMVTDQKSCIIKTGISGGIDIYFGNGDFGFSPNIGDSIEVSYVITEGYNGNIFSKTDSVYFKFIGTGTDENGNSIDLNEVFDVEIEKPIIMGADEESLDLTKFIAPKTSRAYVLANPDNYVHLLSKFGFSYIDASITDINGDYIPDDNIVHLMIIPDIKKKIDSNSDYFTTEVDNFILSDTEQSAVIRYINNSGQQLISTEVNIVSPVQTYYTLNIILRIYDTIDQSLLKKNIISKIGEYFLNVKRRDKLPKSDIIALIENMEGVDSVNLSFVSKTDEEIYRTGLTPTAEQSGLDDFGDIKIGFNEMPLLRGGWYDRYNNYYEDTVDDNVLSSVNIVIKEVIQENLSIKLRNKAKSDLKNSNL